MSEAGSIILVAAIFAMWALTLLYVHTNKKLSAILWPWNNRSVRYAILGRKNWLDITKSDYVDVDGYFDMSRYVENLGAPDFLKLYEGVDVLRLCSPRKGVFFDLYFSTTDGEKMLNRIEKVKIRNLLEYWLMPCSAVYSLSEEAKQAQPCYEYVVAGGNLARTPDFMLTGVALKAFCREMSELAEN